MSEGADILRPDFTAPRGRPVWAERAAELLRKEAFTAAEIHMLQLPGWPKRVEHVRRRLNTMRLSTVETRGPGGIATLYHKRSMPAELRMLIARVIAAELRPETAEPAPSPIEDAALTRSQQQLLAATPRQAIRADARAAVLRLMAGWGDMVGRQGRRAAESFAAAWNAEAIAAAEWVRAELPSLSAPSLMRWQAAMRENGAIALAGAYQARISTIDADPVLLECAEGFAGAHPHGTGAQLIATLRALHRGRALPSYRAACRWLATWRSSNHRLQAHLLSPDAHRSRFRPSFGDAAAGITRPNQLWEMDSTPGDVLLDGKRHAVLGVIDVWTRRKLLLVAPTSSGAGVGLLLRRALLEWGVPETVRTDNGADYISRYVTRVLADLGIFQDITPPFTPEAKPFIERALGSFSHGLLELLPGFSGHNVAEAQELRARRAFADRLMGRGGLAETTLNPVEFQAFCDRWCAEFYAHRPHGGLGGETPAQRAMAYGGKLRRIADERALDALLAPMAGRRVVTKKGLRIDNGLFIAAELALHIGAAVEVRHDPADLGRVYVYGEDGGFLCVAEDPERTGMDREAVAAAAKALARRDIVDARARLRERARKLPKGRALVDAILDAATMGDNVVAFPRAAEPHSTAALQQHGRAARADEAAPALERDAADLARARWLADLAEQRARESADGQERALAEARIARGLAVRAAQSAGAEVEPERAAWFAGYRETGEWRQALRARGICPDTGQPLSEESTTA